MSRMSKRRAKSKMVTNIIIKINFRTQMPAVFTIAKSFKGEPQLQKLEKEKEKGWVAVCGEKYWGCQQTVRTQEYRRGHWARWCFHNHQAGMRPRRRDYVSDSGMYHSWAKGVGRGIRQADGILSCPVSIILASAAASSGNRQAEWRAQPALPALLVSSRTQLPQLWSVCTELCQRW